MTRADHGVGQGSFPVSHNRWRANLESGVNGPMLGASESAFKSYQLSGLRDSGKRQDVLHRRWPRGSQIDSRAELHELRTDQLDADLISMDEWVPNEKLAPVVVGFLRRATSKRK